VYDLNVHIIADSGCDLPLTFFDHENTSFVPLRVQINETDYEDLKTIDPKDVYEFMRKGNVAKTSQASPETFLEIFTNIAKKGQPALYIAFSSELSGTYQTAIMMKEQVKEEYPDFELEIIDSKCASLGHGLLVKKAVELSDSGASLQEITETVKEMSEHMEHLFTVDELEYLARGGRISKAQAFVGGLLNIKPLLHVDNGRLIPLEKIRGKKKLYRKLMDLMEERGVNLSNQTVAISHGDDVEAALELKKMIEERFQPKDVYMNIIGAAIGAHSGPGTLALFFLNKEM